MTFEQYLREINSNLHIEELPDNREVRFVDNLYYKDRRVCCIPAGGKYGRWTDLIHDTKKAKGYETPHGGYHRSLESIGRILLRHKIINPQQYYVFFTSQFIRDRLKKKYGEDYFEKQTKRYLSK